MKRNYSLLTIVLLALFIGFTSCSKDDDIPPLDPDPPTPYIDPWQEFLKEYGLDKTKNTIESVSTGLDTSFICFNGRIDQKLWVGYYNKKTKEQVFEWTELTKLDTIVDVNLGYGEFQKYTIDKFQNINAHKGENIFCFILNGYANYGSITEGRTVSSNLYFFKNNQFAKKYNSTSLTEIYSTIYPWYKGIIVKKENYVTRNYEYTCYSIDGDSLYTLRSYSDFVSDISHYYPIDYDDCIRFSYHNPKEISKWYFWRINIKTGYTLWPDGWTPPSYPLADLPDDTKIDNIGIDKNDNIWTYTINYTLMNGSKGVRKISLNIDSGLYTVS